MSLTLIGDVIEEALIELEGLTGIQTFLWKGKEVRCTPTTLMRGNSLVVAGYEVEIRLTLYVRRLHFITVDSTLITVDSELFTSDDDTPKPVAGRKLNFRGVDYRILRAGEDASRAYFQLDLGDRNR